MPIGIPNSDILSSRKISAFSLDTSVIEAAGFRFNEGPLRHLAGQLPPWMALWMPDVIVREISQHRLDFVARASQQVISGANDLRRHIGDSFQMETLSWIESTRAKAVHLFDDQFQHFLKSHTGIVIEPTHPKLGSEIFNMYFQGRPPFGGGKDKKHEFPDAAALLSLDLMAAEKGLSVIVVSKDAGWMAYAERSQHIYCVSSINELTALFISDTEAAKTIKEKMQNCFENPTIDLTKSIKSTIEKGLDAISWRIIYPNAVRYTVDAEVIETKLNVFDLHAEALGVWITSAKNDACVVEMPLDVNVSLRIGVLANDDFDFGKQIDIGTDYIIIERDFQLKLIIDLSGNLLLLASESLIKKMEIGDIQIDTVLRDADLGTQWVKKYVPRFKGGFDEMDDIPF